MKKTYKIQNMQYASYAPRKFMKETSTKSKIYKPQSVSNTNMHPGDLKGSPDESLSINKSGFSEETLVFLDEGFLYKLIKYLGGGKAIKFNRVTFAKNLAKKENLVCKEIFYYNCPPFQGTPPTKEEEKRKEGYDKFIRSISKEVIVREGRCQRLKIDGKFVFKQKSVDVLLAMDLTNIPLKYPHIKRIILISSDSDFVPVINNLKNLGIRTILYTYYEKIRNTDFSRSNELIKSVYKYVLLTKQDFLNALLNKLKNKENDKENLFN